MPRTTGEIESDWPTDQAPLGPPRRRSLLNELSSVVEPARLGVRLVPLARSPRGDGRPTIDIPGWLAPESSMAPIRGFLRSRGHQAQGWGCGTIRNQVEESRDRFAEQLGSIVGEAGRPANLVGWSLGGVIAREVARTHPELVHRVVTFGTPAIGGPTYTAGASSFGREECRRIEILQGEVDAADPVTVPITAIFTKRDGVVNWRACIDRFSTDVRHVEVRSSHLGLGLDPDVWLATAKALAPGRR